MAGVVDQPGAAVDGEGTGMPAEEHVRERICGA